MRILRLRLEGADHFARWVDEDTARLLSRAPWLGGQETDRLVPLKGSRLLAPVAPSKIVCAARNYRAHAKELGNAVPAIPRIFLKPPSALLGPLEPIVLPAQSERVDHEGELGVVVGKRLHQATAREALGSIYGLTCVNDVTARDLQREDKHFTRSKGFDTFCPCGPWIETEADSGDLAITLRVDGETRQSGRTRDMVWPVGELLAFISSIMSLEPGDLVATGTPEGVGPLLSGNTVELEIEGVGTLLNPVG